MRRTLKTTLAALTAAVTLMGAVAPAAAAWCGRYENNRTVYLRTPGGGVEAYDVCEPAGGTAPPRYYQGGQDVTGALVALGIIGAFMGAMGNGGGNWGGGAPAYSGRFYNPYGQPHRQHFRPGNGGGGGGWHGGGGGHYHRPNSGSFYNEYGQPRR